ncbi:MAG: histone deacetylase, partial [Desulfobulbaceae bacterium]|nr:histone deacetylase [Desulfobulbaceae bacterium]
YAVSKLGMERVLIVDWDLHHGNGTQQSFYKTDKVMYISTHQYPYFPGTGTLMETGTGAGEGYTINIPLPGGQNDYDYARIFNELITPVARLYKPQLILVSAGFDIYKDDPLGLMKVSAAGFAYLTRVMVQLANELCDGSLLFTLEGGYNLRGMLEGSLAVLRELLGESPVDGFPNYLSAEFADQLDSGDSDLSSLDQALELVKNYWDI